MFTKKFQALCVLFALFQPAFAGYGKEDEGIYFVRYFPHHTFRTVTNDDYHSVVSHVESKRMKVGLPGYEEGRLNRESIRKWFEESNLDRQGSEMNYYHLYQICQKGLDGEEKRVGYIQWDYWPTIGYDLEPTCLKDMPRVKGRGIATFLPLLDEQCSEAEIVRILMDSVLFLRDLVAKEKVLPEEGTLPKYLVGLFASEDPLIPLLIKAGFKVAEGECYEDFNENSRVMAYHNIDDEF